MSQNNHIWFGGQWWYIHQWNSSFLRQLLFLKLFNEFYFLNSDSECMSFQHYFINFLQLYEVGTIIILILSMRKLFYSLALNV